LRGAEEILKFGCPDRIEDQSDWVLSEQTLVSQRQGNYLELDKKDKNPNAQ
jgi:hypothetical protein